MIKITDLVKLVKMPTIIGLILLTTSHTVLARTKICDRKTCKNTLYFGSITGAMGANFCMLYDGEVVEVMDDTFSIKDQNLSEINLLVVDPEKIKFGTEENTVLQLSLETKEYKYYKLTPTQFLSPSSCRTLSCSWKITEQSLNEQIPFNTLIVPLNPNTVEISINNVVCKQGGLAVKLPSIKLAQKLGQKSLKDLIAEAYLKSIRLKPFHTKQKVRSITHNAMKISMIV